MLINTNTQERKQQQTAATTTTNVLQRYWLKQ
jgi:hypothetical protein